MPRSRLVPLVAVVVGVSLALIGTEQFVAAAPRPPRPSSPAQQVCRANSLAGGEACFYTGRAQSGREFDVSVPLSDEVSLLTDGGCTDLPRGFGPRGSVINASADTLYVLPLPCAATRPGVLPVAVVAPQTTQDLVPLFAERATGTHSVRVCPQGNWYDADRLVCR